MLPLTRLGKTDISVSRIGLGTVKFGRNQSVKYPETFELPDDKTVRTLLNCARDVGINLLDTAPAYGISEERIGKLLTGARKDWVISTKAGEDFGISFKSGENESRFDFNPDALRLSVERSLRRLRTDYLDIVLIHSDGNDDQIIHEYQVLHTLAELKREGWIRAYGMSTKTLEGGLICAREADVVMTTYDPEQKEDQQLLDVCRANNTGVLLKKIFNSGHLITNPTAPTISNNTAQTHNSAIAEKMKVIFAQKAVNSAIIGTLKPQHLRSNVECALVALAENSKPQ